VPATLTFDKKFFIKVIYFIFDYFYLIMQMVSISNSIVHHFAERHPSGTREGLPRGVVIPHEWSKFRVMAINC